MVNRGERFTQLLGAELKGALVSRGFTAAEVGDALGHSRAAFTNWLNGKAQLPTTVFANACEFVGVEPDRLVERAYERLVGQLGEYAGPLVQPFEPTRSDYILAARDDDDDEEAEAQTYEP